MYTKHLTRLSMLLHYVYIELLLLWVYQYDDGDWFPHDTTTITTTLFVFSIKKKKLYMVGATNSCNITEHG